MARIVYRLWAIKDETNYTELGYTLKEAQQIIDESYDIDEDFFKKTDYRKTAQEYAKQITLKLKLAKPIHWVDLFGDAEDIGYRYCSKCDCYYWDGDECECY